MEQVVNIVNPEEPAVEVIPQDNEASSSNGTETSKEIREVDGAALFSETSSPSTFSSPSGKSASATALAMLANPFELPGVQFQALLDSSDEAKVRFLEVVLAVMEIPNKNDMTNSTSSTNGNSNLEDQERERHAPSTSSNNSVQIHTKQSTSHKPRDVSIEAKKNARGVVVGRDTKAVPEPDDEILMEEEFLDNAPDSSLPSPAGVLPQEHEGQDDDVPPTYDDNEMKINQNTGSICLSRKPAHNVLMEDRPREIAPDTPSPLPARVSPHEEGSRTDDANRMGIDRNTGPMSENGALEVGHIQPTTPPASVVVSSAPRRRERLYEVVVTEVNQSGPAVDEDLPEVNISLTVEIKRNLIEFATVKIGPPPLYANFPPPGEEMADEAVSESEDDEEEIEDEEDELENEEEDEVEDEEEDGEEDEEEDGDYYEYELPIDNMEDELLRSDGDDELGGPRDFPFRVYSEEELLRTDEAEEILGGADPLDEEELLGPVHDGNVISEDDNDVPPQREDLDEIDGDREEFEAPGPAAVNEIEPVPAPPPRSIRRRTDINPETINQDNIIKDGRRRNVMPMYFNEPSTSAGPSCSVEPNSSSQRHNVQSRTKRVDWGIDMKNVVHGRRRKLPSNLPSNDVDVVVQRNLPRSSTQKFKFLNRTVPHQLIIIEENRNINPMTKELQRTEEHNNYTQMTVEDREKFWKSGVCQVVQHDDEKRFFEEKVLQDRFLNSTAEFPTRLILQRNGNDSVLKRSVLMAARSEVSVTDKTDKKYTEDDMRKEEKKFKEPSFNNYHARTLHTAPPIRLRITEDITFTESTRHRIPVYSDIEGETPGNIEIPREFCFDYIHRNTVDKGTESLLRRALEESKKPMNQIVCNCAKQVPVANCFNNYDCPCFIMNKELRGLQGGGIHPAEFNTFEPVVYKHSRPVYYSHVGFACSELCKCEGCCTNNPFLLIDRALYPLEIYRSDEVVGFGLRSTGYIPARVPFMEFCGEIVDDRRLNDSVRDYSMQLTEKTGDKKLYDCFLNESHDWTVEFRDCLKEIKARKFHIDCKWQGNASRFLTHGCIPNVEQIRIYRRSVTPADVRLIFYTLKDIQPGEKIFAHYGDKYLQDRDMYCKCRTAGCPRGDLFTHFKRFSFQKKVYFFYRNELVETSERKQKIKAAEKKFNAQGVTDQRVDFVEYQRGGSSEKEDEDDEKK